MDCKELRRKVIKKYFSEMNDMQFEAVTAVNGPVLVLAGAGSGKTTVLVNRIANLVKFGDGYNSDYSRELTEQEVKWGEDYINGAARLCSERRFFRFARKSVEHSCNNLYKQGGQASLRKEFPLKLPTAARIYGQAHSTRYAEKYCAAMPTDWALPRILQFTIQTISAG